MRLQALQAAAANAARRQPPPAGWRRQRERRRGGHRRRACGGDEDRIAQSPVRDRAVSGRRHGRGRHRAGHIRYGRASDSAAELAALRFAYGRAQPLPVRRRGRRHIRLRQLYRRSECRRRSLLLRFILRQSACERNVRGHPENGRACARHHGRGGQSADDGRLGHGTRRHSRRFGLGIAHIRGRARTAPHGSSGQSVYGEIAYRGLPRSGANGSHRRDTGFGRCGTDKRKC